MVPFNRKNSKIAISHLLAWSFILSGAFLLTISIWTQKAYKSQEFAHRLTAMNVLVEDSQQSLAKHKHAIELLESKNQALYTHLARTQLRLKPENAQPLYVTSNDSVLYVSSQEDLNTYTSSYNSLESVENWLNPPRHYDVEKLTPPFAKPSHPISVFTQNDKSRKILLSLGIFFLFIGCVAPWMPHSFSAEKES